MHAASQRTLKSVLAKTLKILKGILLLPRFSSGVAAEQHPAPCFICWTMTPFHCPGMLTEN